MHMYNDLVLLLLTEEAAFMLLYQYMVVPVSWTDIVELANYMVVPVPCTSTCYDHISNSRVSVVIICISLIYCWWWFGKSSIKQLTDQDYPGTAFIDHITIVFARMWNLKKRCMHD